MQDTELLSVQWQSPDTGRDCRLLTLRVALWPLLPAAGDGSELISSSVNNSSADCLKKRVKDSIHTSNRKPLWLWQNISVRSFHENTVSFSSPQVMSRFILFSLYDLFIGEAAGLDTWHFTGYGLVWTATNRSAQRSPSYWNLLLFWARIKVKVNWKTWSHNVPQISCLGRSCS